MIRRILVIGGLGLAAVGGARFGLAKLAERRWERRREELLALALFQPTERRPWEVRFESLVERLGSSKHLDEIHDSPYRPVVCFGEEAPRRLDAFERVWVESLWNEFTGLDSILAELRKLPLDALEWHGRTLHLTELREPMDALCARAWLAAEAGDSEGAARSYADALRLARATDDGTGVAMSIRLACDGTTLRALRASLALGTSAHALRAAVEPLLADWDYDPARAERVLRRDLAFLRDLDGREADDPAGNLRWFAPTEHAIELAHAPTERFAQEYRTAAARAEPSEPRADSGALDLLLTQLFLEHARHSQGEVALTALAVASFREEHGEFPAALAELPDLAPEHALDPLTGAPLLYAVSEGVARVGPAAWGERVDDYPQDQGSLYVWTLR